MIGWVVLHGLVKDEVLSLDPLAELVDGLVLAHLGLEVYH